MITEMLVKSALEVVIGQGFKAVVERVFSQSQGRSDREILEAVLNEVHRHGGLIGNLDARVVQLEREIGRLQIPSASHVSYAVPLPPSAPNAPGYERGGHFKKTSGGYMNHFNRSRNS